MNDVRTWVAGGACSCSWSSACWRYARGPEHHHGDDVGAHRSRRCDHEADEATSRARLRLRTPRAPTLLDALLPIVVLIGLLALTIVLFGVERDRRAAPGGAAAECGVREPDRVQERLHGRARSPTRPSAGCHVAMSAMFILLAVGALIGTWNMAGTIPTVVDYGIRLVSPTWFYFTAAVVCALVGMVTGQLVDHGGNARGRVRRDEQRDGSQRGDRRRRGHLRRVLRRQDDAAVGDDDPGAQAGRRRTHRRASTCAT